MLDIPPSGPEDWKQFLAEPDKHWRTGYSAKTTAHCWKAAQGFPPEIQRIFEADSKFEAIEPLLIIPEYQVPLEGGIRPSQNDVWVLARLPSGLVSIAVEATAGEPFGRTIAEWGPESTPGKSARLKSLCDLLGLVEDPPKDLRYQLLHRTASSVIEAERFFATRAVIVVQAFEAPQDSFDDFSRFADALGGKAVRDELMSVGQRNGVDLSLGWATGDNRFLSA